MDLALPPTLSPTFPPTLSGPISTTVLQLKMALFLQKEVNMIPFQEGLDPAVQMEFQNQK